MTKYRAKTLLVCILFSLFIAFCYFLLSTMSINSTRTITALNSILATLSISGMAVVYYSYKNQDNENKIIFLIPLLYLAYTHFGGAAGALLAGSDPYALTEAVVMGDSLKTVVFLLLVFVIMLLRDSSFRIQSNRKRSLVASIFFILAAANEWVSYYFFFPILDVLSLQYFGVFCILLSLVLLFAIFRSLTIRHIENESLYNEYVLVFFMLIVLSESINLYSLFTSTELWSFSIGIQVMAFLFLIVALTEPMLRRLTNSMPISRIVTVFISVLALLPFIATLILEILTNGVAIYDRLAFAISHFGAIILSCEMALLLILYARQKPNPAQTPLIVLFLSLVIIESCLWLSIYIPVIDMATDSIILFITGSVITLISLLQTTRLSSKIAIEEEAEPKYRVIILSLFAVLILILVSYAIGFQIGMTSPSLLGTSYGDTILLMFNILIMFIFTYASIQLAKQAKGLISIELLAVLVVSLWTTSNIFRVNYIEWTAGWWVGEIFRDIGLVISPLIVGILYLRLLRSEAVARSEATVFADILMHDIRNHLHAIQLSIDLAELRSASSTSLIDMIQSLNYQLARANNLITNVERVARNENLSNHKLQKTDLMFCIKSAHEFLRKGLIGDDFLFELKCSHDQCYVKANDLLLQVFVNIFLNSIEHSEDEKKIEVDIVETVIEDTSYWEVRTTDYGHGINPILRPQLFTRFMKDANGRGLGLSVVKSLVTMFNGLVSIENREVDDYTKGTVFRVLLPKMEKTELG